MDWRPTERNSFSASLNLLRWVSPNGLQTQAVLNNGNGVGNNVNSSVRAKYGRFTWTAIPTNTTVNEFRFGWLKDKQFDYPNDALGIPGIGFLGINITGQSNLGTATDYPRTNPSENRFQFADTVTWTHGQAHGQSRLRSHAAPKTTPTCSSTARARTCSRISRHSLLI